MKQYPWPGNVRELQNICERASVMTKGRQIPAGTIRPWLVTPELGAQVETQPDTSRLEDVQRQQIVRTLARCNGNRQQAARSLGIGVRTLGLKLKKWKELNLVAQTV